ncbi:MAG: outer membrane beta-barrel protein [Prevotellaceae bacterium]|jgi:hypothetical protein|nr:outer membrane beta-barrel protein [Prevotellaceae bacterium]
MNKLHTLGVLLLLLSSVQPVRGQNKDEPVKGFETGGQYYFSRVVKIENSIQVGVDVGNNLFDAALQKPEDFRNANVLSPYVNQLFFGATIEKQYPEHRFAVSSGLYFNQISSYLFSLLKYDNTYTFLLTQGLTQGEGDEAAGGDLNSLSLRNVHTISSGVSIPIDVRYTLIQGSRLELYVKAGARVGFNIYTSTNFVSTTNAETKKMIRAYFKNDHMVFSNADLMVGIRRGSVSEFNYRIEVGYPIALTTSVSNLEILRSAFTVRLQFYFPLAVFYNNNNNN